MHLNSESMDGKHRFGKLISVNLALDLVVDTPNQLDFPDMSKDL